MSSIISETLAPPPVLKQENVLPKAKDYRPDIDGLRCLAVMSVVLFHLGLTSLGGGYAGVDIFFVISGYLITGHIYREIQDDHFSIISFYEKRVRRIGPALVATLILVLVAASVIFMPDELRDLGASLVATAAFCSNILFYLQADYFAGPVDTKPLLHTWSLAVEEQFYILIPPLMVILYRRSAQSVKWGITILAAASFAASCAWVWIDPSANYYLPHTRAWELLLGSMVALGCFPRLRGQLANEIAAAVGFLAIIATIALLWPGAPFPAWNALPLCVGTALVIGSGSTCETLVSRLLGWKPFVAVGLISYSLYLVHWPMIVFAKYWLLREPTLIESAGLLVAMFVFAWLSWRFVERPMRRPASVSRRQLFVGFAICSIVIVGLGAATFKFNGFPQRFGAQTQIAQRDRTQEQAAPKCFMKKGWDEWGGDACFLTHGTGRRILLWGDSHANHFASALRDRDDEYETQILQYASAGCPPILGVEIKKRPSCADNNRHALEIIQKYGIKDVVLSSYWERIFHDNNLSPKDLNATIRQLEAMGLRVSVIGDNPDFPFSNPAFLGVRLAKRADPNAPFYTTVRNQPDFNAKLDAAVPGTFYDPMKRLCRDGKCLAYDKGKLLMSDNAHLSRYGAKIIVSDLDPILK
jgi:peptidoglycan/LPS O-acetylase OafA/YrhL